MTLNRRVPRDDSLRMPAEWAQHHATWMSWPFDDDMWFGHLAAVRREYAELVRTICRFEPVHLLLRDAECAASARELLGQLAGLTTHEIPLDDVWLRDNGALFVVGTEPGKPRLAAVNWEFNSWGEKYSWEKDNQVPLAMASWLGLPRYDAGLVMEGGSIDVDGTGLALTTEQCLLHPKRNPGLDRRQLEQALGDYLGIDEVIWLGLGLEGDHTDGHIDTITRFVGPGRVVTSVGHDRSDVNFARMQANLRTLKAFKDRQGRGLEVLELPLPERRLELEDGTRLAPSYANFYLCNGAVIVPQYGDPQDGKALDVLAAAFPDREVIGLASRHIIMGGGSFHCLTQQQPEAP